MHLYVTNSDQKNSPFNFLFESILSPASLHSFKELVLTCLIVVTGFTLANLAPKTKCQVSVLKEVVKEVITFVE